MRPFYIEEIFMNDDEPKTITPPFNTSDSGDETGLFKENVEQVDQSSTESIWINIAKAEPMTSPDMHPEAIETGQKHAEIVRDCLKRFTIKAITEVRVEDEPSMRSALSSLERNKRLPALNTGVNTFQHMDC